jgi:thiosulfate dehydrogenase
VKLKLSIIYLSIVFLFCYCSNSNNSNNDTVHKITKIDTIKPAVIQEIWATPDTNTIPKNELGDAIRYGKQLILNTAYYIGPNGVVSKNLGNKMNCTNCHLEGGTRPYAFNYVSSHARYPQYRARENRILSLAERVNNCIERPHNGKPLKLDSKEMTAIICYIKWLGESVPTNKHVKGDSPLEIEFLDRAANSENGKKVYIEQCQSCHGVNGEGKMKLDNVSYENPPLWGLQSYQPGSSLHRVIKMAAFVYANMPNKIATYTNPKLTIEEAFDVAAFINDDKLHKRPINKGLSNYPNYKTKPVDYGKGPYNDTFSEFQHKFGPFKPIVDYKKSAGLPVVF